MVLVITVMSVKGLPDAFVRKPDYLDTAQSTRRTQGLYEAYALLISGHHTVRLSHATVLRTYFVRRYQLCSSASAQSGVRLIVTREVCHAFVMAGVDNIGGGDSSSRR